MSKPEHAPMGATPTTTVADPNTVMLETAIQRAGGTPITTVTLRRPKSGELRGVSLTDLLQLQVDALTVVLPRITQPTLLKHEVADLDPADLVQLGTKVATFFLTKAQLADSPAA